MGEVLAGATMADGWSDLALRGLQIVWINVLLSGDNAVVIALACRRLDGRRRVRAIAGGAGLAVGLRIVLTFFVVTMLGLPAIKLVGGALLLWIAFDLLRARPGEEVEAAGSIWGAIRTIAVADVVMSLDNVVAVAAAARNSVPLIVFGIALSVPLIVFGSTLILAAMRRFPFLVVAGAVLLGWVAGGMVAEEPLLARPLGRLLARPWARLPGDPALPVKAAGAALVLAGAAAMRLLRRRGTRTGGNTGGQVRAEPAPPGGS